MQVNGTPPVGAGVPGRHPTPGCTALRARPGCAFSALQPLDANQRLPTHGRPVEASIGWAAPTLTCKCYSFLAKEAMDLRRNPMLAICQRRCPEGKRLGTDGRAVSPKHCTSGAPPKRLLIKANRQAIARTTTIHQDGWCASAPSADRQKP